MPRIAEHREAAEPTSPEQKERVRRILRAAAEHGTAHPLERVQMQEVARDAGVAIATLYRYFPSKTHLFTALLHHQVSGLQHWAASPPPGLTPDEAVAEMLIEAQRRLHERPQLTLAMLQSNNATVGPSPSTAVTSTFADLILATAGVADPTAHDHRLVRLIEQTWYGVLMSRLNGHIDDAEAESDTRLACALLLGGLGRPDPTKETP